MKTWPSYTYLALCTWYFVLISCLRASSCEILNRDGNALSKNCGLRSSRFSRQAPERCRPGGFPFSPPRVVTKNGTGLPLRPHCNPQRALSGSLGVFPDGSAGPLASFAVRVSPARMRRLLPWPRKAGYTAPTLSTMSTVPRAGLPPSRSSSARDSPRTWASTAMGSTPACHCGSPHLLNPQHQPPPGRRRPAPGTSSICP